MHYTYAHMEVCRLSLPARARARSRSRRASGGWSGERARARAVITFYFKDGRGSFAILCRTSICLIYRNYTYTDPVRFCYNLYPEYRRTRPAVSSSCACIQGVLAICSHPIWESRVELRKMTGCYDVRGIGSNRVANSTLELCERNFIVSRIFDCRFNWEFYL